AVTNFFSTAYSALICADVQATEATTAEVDPTTGGQLTKAADPRNDAGTSEAACLPFQCAVVVSLRTALATRAGRGRMYTPGVAVDQQDGGRLVTAAQTTIADSAKAMMDALNGAGLAPVIYHKAAGNFDGVTSLDVGDVIDTQRRRRNKLIEGRTSRVV
ncbi:MAG TPA: hypothetical protein VLV83_26210, partial [Acidobacteriota bacterium]|nr:hypothetical protein [Acidobacteriota bacterium]